MVVEAEGQQGVVDLRLGVWPSSNGSSIGLGSGSGASGFGGGSGSPPEGAAVAWPWGSWSPVVFPVVFPLKDCFCLYLGCLY